MSSILFNNRFAKSYQTLSDSTLKTWARLSDYRTRFSALSNYSKGLVTNALYSKTTATAFVVMAAGAGITLWYRYRAQNKMNRHVSKVDNGQRVSTLWRSSSVRTQTPSDSKAVFEPPKTLPEKGNVSAVVHYIDGLQLCGNLTPTSADNLKWRLAYSSSTYFVAAVSSAVTKEEITPSMANEIMRLYCQEKK